VIAGALSVVLAVALAGDPPEPATPDAAAPAPEVVAPARDASEAPAGAASPAAGSFVAVVRPAAQDPLLQEASSRIRSELTASGVESRLVDCTEPTEAPCPGPDATAAIALGRKDGVIEIDVRAFLPDGLELSRHVRVLDRDGGQDPSVLAVRAVELLRDLRLNAQRRAPAGPPKPATDAEEPKIPLPPPPPPRWRLSTGVGVLAAPASNEPGMGPALGANLAAGTIIGPHFAAVLTVAGPFNSGFSTAHSGKATLIQGLATLELRYRFPLRAVQPFIATMTGVNYLHANVTSASTMARLAPPVSTAWVPLFGAGGGLSYDLGERFSIVAEAEIFVTAPSELVGVDNNTVVARTGAPSILLTSDLSLTLP
jgi:hypothetical protein